MRSDPGAPAAQGTIPLCVSELGAKAWEYVKEALDASWVSSAGPFTQRFEGMLADYIGARHAVATVSGTAALHIGLLVVGVEPDDEVLVSELLYERGVSLPSSVGLTPEDKEHVVETVHSSFRAAVRR